MVIKAALPCGHLPDTEPANKDRGKAAGQQKDRDGAEWIALDELPSGPTQANQEAEI